ncbi:MAG: hypothetical protein IPL41_11460 [Micropruina sp.]|nr:hypothetical protein [Micropruina sp.]
MRDLPPLDAKVHETVAEALAGRVSPDALAGPDALADAAAVLLALAELVAGLDALEPAPAQPARPTMAAAERPLRNARRVTAE